MARRGAGEGALVAALLALLALAIVYPLLHVLSVAFLDGGWPTARPLLAFFARPLFREALANTLLSGLVAVAVGSAIAVPLAVLTVRYAFPGRTLITVLGVLPLVVPPFVGAVAFQQILGRSGAVNLLLREHAGFTIPFMEGLPGVVLVQSLHYFPFILLNTAAALAGLDRSLEEAAQNLGCSGLRLYRRVLLPLALPGYAAGALLAFIRVIDDLGTPLMLNYTRLLAPQAYVRVTTIGLTDVDGYVICVILVALSLGALPSAARWGRGPSRSCCWGPRSCRTRACSCCRSRACGASRRCPTPTPSRTTGRSWSARPGSWSTPCVTPDSPRSPTWRWAR